MTNRNNAQWLSDLRDKGEAREAALEDLHAIILRGLPFALSRWLSPTNPQFESLTEEVAQETLLRVLDQMHTFEGRSQFTTWVHKIAIRIALTELRRKRWQDSSLDEMVDNEEIPVSPRILEDSSATPEQSAERADMMERIRRVIDEELTERQRSALDHAGDAGHAHGGGRPPPQYQPQRALQTSSRCAPAPETTFANRRTGCTGSPCSF